MANCGLLMGSQVSEVIISGCILTEKTLHQVTGSQNKHERAVDMGWVWIDRGTRKVSLGKGREWSAYIVYMYGIVIHVIHENVVHNLV